MKKYVLSLAISSLFSTAVMASANLYNSDSQSYRLLLDSSESCFSGTHTSIESNTRTSVSSGWACLGEEKPAVKLEDGKSYVIRNGVIQEE
ncbi:MAG TPA: hypothetical protein PKE49_17350 [Leptospiraceae bacterium]|nr:hypothetical protein [Leptospirales bacterium]HMX58296.1 hypothetical protein [Leptospiraceae bacterium]HMY46118.1 hypothetical protein [Leptospiraceae bacterium]HNE22393.1 hypothetical protein [Leptospiraceae bacterium]HNL00374.1 hypothetical protein [Leptospiraceae bacterium]